MRFIRHAALISATLSVMAATLAVVAPTAIAATTACTDVDVVIARGTTEPGTLGAIVGDPFYTSLKKDAPGKTFSAYPVNYPASLDLSSATIGNQDTVNHVNAQAAACPNQKFVLVGYSQGANVIENSIGISSDGALTGAKIVATLGTNLVGRIPAIALYGSPNLKRGIGVTGLYATRTTNICQTNDIICDPNGLNYLAHNSYFLKLTQTGAAFVAARL